MKEEKKRITSAEDFINAVKRNTDLLPVRIMDKEVVIPVYYNLRALQIYIDRYELNKDKKDSFCGMLESMIDSSKNLFKDNKDIIQDYTIENLKNISDEELNKVGECIIHKSKDLQEMYVKDEMRNFFDNFHEVMIFEYEEYKKHTEEIAEKIVEPFKSSYNKALGLENFDKRNKIYEQFFGVSSKMAQMNSISNKVLGGELARKRKLNEKFFEINSKMAEMNYITYKALGIESFEQRNKIYGQFFGLDSRIAEMNTITNKVLGTESFEQRNKIYEQFFGVSSKMAQINNISSNILKLNGLNGKYGLNNKVWEASSRMLEMNSISNKVLGFGINEIFEKIDFGSVKVNEDGTLNYFDTTINLESDINDAIHAFNANENDSIEKIMYNLFLTMKKKNPIIVGAIIMFLVAPFYQSYIDYSKGIINDKIKKIQVETEMSNNKNKLQSDIKKEVSKEWCSSFSQDKNAKKILKEYRFVTTDCLNVRINSSTNSKVVYNLKFGQVVSLLNKNRNWALIEYTDDENIYVRGWVYARYISEFK